MSLSLFVPLSDAVQVAGPAFDAGLEAGGEELKAELPRELSENIWDFSLFQ